MLVLDLEYSIEIFIIYYVAMCLSFIYILSCDTYPVREDRQRHGYTLHYDMQ
jgi:hypothetical protein